MSPSVRLKISVALVKNSKFFLIKEWSEKSQDHKWNFVKGTVENEKIEDCVLREIEEEVNVKAEIKESVGTHVNFYGDNKFTVYFLYTAEIKDGKPSLTNKKQQKTRAEDILEIRWFSKEELSEMNNEDFVSDVSYMLLQKLLNKSQKVITTKLV